jgi:hypothetical protein
MMIIRLQKKIKYLIVKIYRKIFKKN